MQIAPLFIKEHEKIRRALAVLEEMANQTERGNLPDRHDIHALLIFLHYFVDMCHQEKEEKILFPALQRSHCTFRTEKGICADVARLLREHTNERGLVESAQRQLFSDNPADFIKNARALVHLLSSHAQWEEQELFPLAEALSPEESGQAAMLLEQADGQFGRLQLNLLTELLEELERKYTRKAA